VVAVTDAATATRPLEWSPPRTAISRVPYLPGLDGMRALAVLAVMVYHANNNWLPGGFLGVEVFFVISGYLITLLLIGEHERTGTVSIRNFYLRRARRLLPALYVLLIGLTIYTALFRREVLGQLRGDVLAALTYTSNWYQIWVGQGYTASGDFAPLRHLWSLAVEEQFYLLWPLVMIGLIRRGRRRLPEMAKWLFLAAVLVTVLMAVLYYPGEIGTCEVTPDAYWHVAGRCISKTEYVYLGTLTRGGGLLLGAAFALVWRPVALMRGPMRRKGHLVDVFALAGLAGLAALTWYLHIITPEGTADPWLFRGGFFVCGLATLALIAGVTHRGAWAGRLLGNPLLLWIGLRSYGIYLFHWPIYQGIRGVAGRPLTISEFVLALAITAVACEISYRFIEMPVRRRHVGRWWRRLQAARDPAPRRVIAAVGAGVVALSVFAAANLATAELKPNEIAQSLDEGQGAVTDLNDITGTTTRTTVAAAAPTTVVPTTAPSPSSVPGGAAAPTRPSTPRTTATTSAPTTSAPADPIQTLAIGDSVMLGAAPALAAEGITVDAAVSRQMVDMVPVVQALREQGRLGDAVVVHLGTNGDISDETLTSFFRALRGVPKVLVLLVNAPGKPWIGPNNAKLAALPAHFPNVEVVDWPEFASRCPGDCLYEDGIHLKPDGQRRYAEVVSYFLGN
jgi:peptidoglycan/LPS O-acetylase OafA/YrhL